MRDIIKPSIILFLVCLVVTLGLAFTYSVTKEQIAQRAEIDAENARKEVLSGVDSFKAVENIDNVTKSKPELEPVKEAYKGMKGNSVAGYVFKAVTKGYGGAIGITVGVDTQGRITGIKIGDNKETPGLGTKAADKPFVSQFEGITPKEALQVIKSKKSKPEEIEAISGATITSKAVTKAVQAAINTSREIIQKEGGKK